MSKQQHGGHAFRFGEIFAYNGRFHRLYAAVAADNLSAIASQILLKPCQFGGEAGSLAVIDDQNQLPSIFCNRRVDSGTNISVARVNGGSLGDTILVLNSRVLVSSM